MQDCIFLSLLTRYSRTVAASVFLCREIRDRPGMSNVQSFVPFQRTADGDMGNLAIDPSAFDVFL
jgi:hypothetical protein